MKLCHICGSTDSTMFCEKDSYTLHKCQACGFIFVYPLPTDLEAVYGEEYFHDTGEQAFGYTDYDSDKESMRSVFEFYLKKLEQLVVGRNILDVGCATGYFLDIAKKRGWNTFGVEISEYAAQEATKRGHTVLKGNLPELHVPEKMDVVTMWDVLEHVDDPRSYLHAVHNCLIEEGYVAINTPDTGSLWARVMGKRWHLVVPPEHVHYYNAQNLKKLLSQTGFDVLEVKKIGKKFSLPYIFMTAYRWQGFSLWKHFATWFGGPSWRNIAVPVNFRDNIFVLAKKQKKANDSFT